MADIRRGQIFSRSCHARKLGGNWLGICESLGKRLPCRFFQGETAGWLLIEEFKQHLAGDRENHATTAGTLAGVQVGLGEYLNYLNTVQLKKKLCHGEYSWQQLESHQIGCPPSLRTQQLVSHRGDVTMSPLFFVSSPCVFLDKTDNNNHILHHMVPPSWCFSSVVFPNILLN